MNCACCKRLASRGKLCDACDGSRLLAASSDRCIRGETLTYSNAERFSQENWIRMVLDGQKRTP